EYGTVVLSESVSLFDVLDSISEKVEHIVPLPMEDIGQAYGYTLYRTTVNRQGELKFNSGNIRDRSSIYVNGRFVTTTYINDEDKTVVLDFPAKVNTLEIFVENMGRANYGEHLTDPKGLIKNLWL